MKMGKKGRGIVLAKVVTFAGALLLAGVAVATTGQEDAKRALDGVFGHIRSGATFTAQFDRLDGREPSTTLERTYVSGPNFRTDEILDYQPGKPLHDPLVMVGLITPTRRISGDILLRGDFKTPEEVFASAIAHPSPAIRMAEDTPVPISGRTSQVLGFDGTHWMSDELKKWDDGSVTSEGVTRIVTYGRRAQLTRRFVIDPRNPLLEGYSLTANPGSTTVVTSIKIARDPASKVNEAVYNVDGAARTSPPGDIHYRLTFLQEKFGRVDPSVFTYDDSNGSLIVKRGEKEVSRVVDGKRIKNYGKVNRITDESPKHLLFIRIAEILVIIVVPLSLWLGFRLRRKFGGG